jgi:hypothetical protein
MKKTVFLLLLLVLSCQTKEHFEKIELRKPTMVSITPDDQTIAALEEKWGEEDFFIIIDDVMWYHSELMMLVDSLNIEQVNTDKRKITLTGNKNQWSIDMDTTQNKWRYIYFDGEAFLETDAINMSEYLSTN